MACRDGAEKSMRFFSSIPTNDDVAEAWSDLLASLPPHLVRLNTVSPEPLAWARWLVLHMQPGVPWSDNAIGMANETQPYAVQCSGCSGHKMHVHYITTPSAGISRNGSGKHVWWCVPQLQADLIKSGFTLTGSLQKNYLP